MVPVANRRGIERQKPNIVQDYNNGMPGIDRSDQMLSYHSGLCKTVRWYKKVGVHMAEMMLTNAFYLYVKFAPNPHLNTVKIYREHIVGPSKKGKERRPRGRYHCLSTIPSSEKKKNLARKCCHCSTPQKRKETRYECTYCTDQHCASTPAFEFFTRIWVFFGMTLSAIVVMTMKNSKYGITFQQNFAS